MAKTAIVSSAELFSQPPAGAPLTADYWVNRRDGESYQAYKHRRGIEIELGIARRHARLLQRNLDRITEMVRDG